MSSLRNAVHRREHRERSQLASRERLGLLEKHKDYVLRARDYNKKQKRLRALQLKAAFKNPDEFYFKMQSTKTKDGVHIAERNEKFSADFLKLLKTQDKNYVNFQNSINKLKIEKLKNTIHFIENNKDEENNDSNETTKAKHTIFVEDEEEAKNFDPAKHFNTYPELLSRKFNRPTKEIIKSAKLNIDDNVNVEKLVKAKSKNIRELSSRIQREKNLTSVQNEMDIQKALMGKGRRRKVGTDKNGLPVYKWKQERKK
eukprot:jgi/Orpsp1_1/1176845/evm.model.c7180000059228.1